MVFCAHELFLNFTMVSLFFSGIHFQNSLYEGMILFAAFTNEWFYLLQAWRNPGGSRISSETEVGLIQTKVLICLIQWLHRHSLSCQCQSGAGMGWAGRAGLSRAVESFQLNDMISLQKSSSSSWIWSFAWFCNVQFRKVSQTDFFKLFRRFHKGFAIASE